MIVEQDPNADPGSIPSARVSGSGRHVVFTSPARLSDSDRNDFADVYVLDLGTGHVSLESIAGSAGSANGWSYSPGISRDGRYVVFEATAGNLTQPEFPSGTAHVFLRDRQHSVTRLLTSNAHGEPANGSSGNPAISADGTTVRICSLSPVAPACHSVEGSAGIAGVPDDQGNAPHAKILLEANPPIRRDQQLVAGLVRNVQRCAVAQPAPALGLRRMDSVLGLSATNSRTAVTCSRVNSNCSITSSTPRSSRFSMTVATGRRVPLNTHAPPTRLTRSFGRDTCVSQ